VKPLSKGEIRVRYSGFIIFASQIISLVTGLVFTLMLTRNMDNGEFGVWSFLFYLTGLFGLLNGMFPFWVTRFVARGKTGAIKTAISANLLLSLAAVAIYIPLAPLLLGYFNISEIYLTLYLIAGFNILNNYMIAVFEASLRSVKPQATGYGLLIAEVTKIAAAVLLIMGLRQVFLGAILAIIVGVAAQLVFYTWLLGAEFRQPLHLGYLREWLKGSTVYLYNAVGVQLTGLVVYLLFLFGGNAALGDFQAATTFSVVIGYASSLTFALYPKMLAVTCPKEVASSFKTMLMLALPMATVAIVMPLSLLTILNSSYRAAAPVLVLLSVDALVVLVGQFYSTCLLGAETLDVEGKISVRQLFRSKIFKVFSVPYVQAAIALPAVYVVLTQVFLADSVTAVLYTVTVNIVVHFVTTAGLYGYMRREVKIPIAWKSIGKYLIGCLATAAVLYALPMTTTLAATFGKILVGVGVYAAILLAIEKDARDLVRQVWEEIHGNFH
jgi:O-antigen/teichoic acid export membrane protein